MTERPTIAHYLHIDPLLPESFLTDQINRITRFNQLVLTQGADKRELFRNSTLHFYKCGHKYVGPNRFRRAVDRLWFPYSQTCREFRRLFATHNVRLLHAHFATDALDMLPLKRRLDLPMVVSCYGYDVSSFPRHPANRLRIGRLFSECEKFLVLSDDMKQDLLELGCQEHKIQVHHLGVDLQIFRPDPQKRRSSEQEIRLLSVGFFVEKKGHLFLLEALRRLLSNGHHLCHLTLVGQGPLESEIRKRIGELELGNYVTIHKTIDRREVLSQYQRADIFILPSFTARDGNKEGTPTVLMEAQAVGLPVVSTTHAGIREVVQNEVSGYLVPERDVNAIVTCLEKLMNEKERWSEMGRQGRSYIDQHFNIRTQVAQLQTIYDNVSIPAELCE